MNKRFSERLGFVEVNKELQIESMNDDLRNSLWNLIYRCCNKIDATYKKNKPLGSRTYKCWSKYAEFCAFHYFKVAIDSKDIQLSRQMWLKNSFYKLTWLEVLDLVELSTNKFFCSYKGILSDLEQDFNHILERELSGYRFINGLLAPITNESEINSINEAIKFSSNYEKLKGVHEHIKMALTKLSLKPEPDYRNSIKESVSAVESLVRKISGKSKLSESLKFMNTKFNLHTCLQLGFEKLYNYSSDENGIRHAILDESDIGFDEAKYMLVSCSAFINYLISKANKYNLI